MKVNIPDLQRRYWPILGYLPYSLMKNLRLVYILGLTGSDVILVTNDHKVYFYGLSLNLTESRFHDLSNLTEIKELSQKPIKSISNLVPFTDSGFSCNSQHCSESSDLSVVVHFMSGEVYLWGYNPSVGEIRSTPSLIEQLPKTVVKVACGQEHFVALTSDGMVYAWGDNMSGQIASNLTEEYVTEPRRISFPFNDVVAEIACGSYLSVVVTSKHEVFGWGKNTDGQLGESEEGKYMPVEVPAFKKRGIQKIVCGDRHMLALDECGVLFVCGNNNSGQLGFETFTDYAQGVSNTSLRFKETAVAGDSSVGETLDGDIMVWGFIGDETFSSPLKTPCRSMNEAFALYRLGGMHEQIEVSTGSENPAEVVETVTETVAETVRKSFGNPEMSDFKIIIEDKEIHVHKYLLAHRSKYFERMFANNWSEGKMSCIKMDESYEAMSAFLKYLYTDEISNGDMKVLIDVAIIAEKYCDSNVVNFCLKQFQYGLNESNVAELYELTLDQRLSNFNDLCITYASRCLSAVVASKGYSSWNPETFKNFFQHDKIKSALK